MYTTTEPRSHHVVPASPRDLPLPPPAEHAEDPPPPRRCPTGAANRSNHPPGSSTVGRRGYATPRRLFTKRWALLHQE
jgi:hypothetical protein